MWMIATENAGPLAPVRRDQRDLQHGRRLRRDLGIRRREMMPEANEVLPGDVGLVEQHAGNLLAGRDGIPLLAGQALAITANMLPVSAPGEPFVG